jgi:preprotein translocase subunit YajC
MFISTALAAAAGAQPPSALETFMLNMLLIAILVGLFYVLMIMPQQKRFKKHTQMINKMKKGDKILTASGFVGKIDKLKDGEPEMLVDFGNGVKMTMLRSSIQNKASEHKMLDDIVEKSKPAKKTAKKDVTKDAKKDAPKKATSKKAGKEKAA